MSSQPQPARRTVELNATLLERIDFNPELAVFRIRPDSGRIPDFEPGQYTTLGLPDPAAPPEKPRLIRRAYSIASSPNQKDCMEFYIVLVKEGKLTPLLWQLKSGDKIFMDDRCKGNFTMEGVPDGVELVMISTGTGLAPYISMMRTYRPTKRWPKWIIINGVRHAVDLGYKEELEAAAKEGDVVYVPMVTRDPDYPGVKGRVTSLLEDNRFEEVTGSRLDPQRCHVFLCGNPQMIIQMQEGLEKLGFKVHSKREPGNLHIEKYW